MSEKDDKSHGTTSLAHSNILVSIVLTESTTDLLQLKLPYAEDVIAKRSKHADMQRDSILRVTSESRVDDEGEEENEEFDIFGMGDDIRTEVAYFTKEPYVSQSVDSVVLSNDLSNTNVPTNRIADKTLDVKLVPILVYTRPLLVTNREKNEEDNIFAQILESQSLSSKQSDWVNICRICHGGESIGDLLEPCQCRGSIALAHVECLEHWLKESANSHCELCQHHYEIIREPKYSILNSIFVFLRHPGEHYRELMLDLVAFVIYTPSAIASTYMLMLLCESVAKSTLQQDKHLSAHVMAFTSIIGMAAIDFTYSSWLMMVLQKHVAAWKMWYRTNCNLKVILPDRRQKKHKKAASSKS